MAIIPLTRGFIALVDDEDAEAVLAKKWSASVHRERIRAQHYWREDGKVKGIGLGRFLLDSPEGMVVDHINGDSLDNRRANLRVCLAAENSLNRRKHIGGKNPYKGVYRYGRGWKAVISRQGIVHQLGRFETPEAAALAYDQAARSLHGEFARTNMS